MSFDSASDFANHKSKFCVQSEYFDPIKLQQSLHAGAGESKQQGDSVLSFAQVQEYLNSNSTSGGIGKISLQELKSTLKKGEVDMERLRRRVRKDREREKAEELKALKLRQQQVSVQKKQDEEGVVALIKEIELRKEEELRARAMREKVKEELRELDSTGMQSLEEERKTELLELAKQKELLLLKEKAALADITALENRVKDQELRQRQEESELQKLLEANESSERHGKDKRVANLRQSHMERCERYGAQTSVLASKQEELKKRQQEITKEMNQLGSTNQKDDEVPPINFDEEHRRLQMLEDQYEKETIMRREILSNLNRVNEVTKEVPKTSPKHCTARPESSPEKPPQSTLDSLEREILQRNLSDQVIKQSRPSTPLQSLAPPPNIQTQNISPNFLYQTQPPHGQPPQGQPPQVQPPPGAPPAWNPYTYPPPQIPPMSYNPYSLQYPMQTTPFHPFYNGYSGFAATGAAIMGYPPPMHPYGAYPPMMMPFESPPDPETVKLQQQLDAMKQLKEQRELEMETLRFQSMLNSIQAKIPGIVRETPDPPPQMSAQPSTTSLKTSVSDEEFESKTLKSLRLKHAEEMLKLKQQRDLMEEEEKIEALKEQRERRRREMEEQVAHEEWLANQKRTVLALRMKKVIAQELPLPSVVDDDTIDIPYDVELGFSIFWDYAIMVPTQSTHLQITYAVYDGPILRSKHKIIRARECEPHGASFNRCVFATHREFDHLPASLDLRLLVEIAIVPPPQPVNERRNKSISLGWTAMDLFFTKNNQVVMCHGNIKLPIIQSPLPQINTNSKWNLPIAKQTPDEIVLCIRLLHAAQVDEGMNFPVNPDTTFNKYHFPSNQINSNQSKDDSIEVNTPKRKNSKAPNQGTIDRQRQTPTHAPLDRIPSLGRVTPSQTPTRNLQPSIDKSEKGNLPPVDPTSINKQLTPPKISVTKDLLYSGEGWLDVDLSAQRKANLKNLFNRGDGFDIYVDGARSLPDGVTVTKLTCFALNTDMSVATSLQDSSCIAPFDTNTFSPTFNLWLEYRAEKFNPLLTLLCRVDTIDRLTKNAIVVGYAVLPIFLDPSVPEQGLKAPFKSSAQEYCLNTGSFQLPIRLGVQLGTDKIDFNSCACDGFIKLPCATLLVRIFPATKSADGLKCLNRSDVPQSEWIQRELIKPAPQYHEKHYDSTISRPSIAEDKLYRIRKRQRQSKPVHESLVGIADKATLETSEQRNAWLQTFFNKKPTKSMLDSLSTICRYEQEIGFRVAIDGLHNVQGGCLYKVLQSISPPASFYQDPKLTDDVNMTLSYEWTTSQSSPAFSDGYVTYRDVMQLPNAPMTLILDVRSLKEVKGSWVSSQIGWTYIHILNASQCVAGGCYQLPLFHGPVLLDILRHETPLDELVATETTKKKGLISYIPGASAFVRLEDGCLPNSFSQPMIDIISNAIPSAFSSKYTYDKAIVATQSKKRPLNKLIGDKTERDLEKELNQTFAKEMGISH